MLKWVEREQVERQENKTSTKSFQAVKHLTDLTWALQHH